MREHIYRAQITIQELDTDGFWSVFDSIEMANTKAQLLESFEKIFNNCKEYIAERLE